MLNKINNKINPVWKQSELSQSFFLYLVFFIRQHCISELSPFLLNMESHMEGDFFPIHLDKISKDPKCVAAAEMPDLGPKFSSLKEFLSLPGSVAVPNVTLLYIKPTGCDNLLGDCGAKNLLYLDSPESVFLHLKDGIVHRDISSVAAEY